MKREFRVTLTYANGMIMHVFFQKYEDALSEFQSNMDHAGHGTGIIRQTLEYGTSDKDGTFFSSGPVQIYEAPKKGE